ncbi:phosphotransferase [Phenylobacterium sp. LjRoot219]|uniref:phosphotransferase n=1 Tax=Phenylobacterium sp. LjRoot219 TaxID=3342283 RepID=UPI003ECE185F
MAGTRLPTDPQDLTVDHLNALLAAQSPGVALTDFTVTETHLWGGGQASSAGRMVIAPTYAASAPRDLPRSLIIKVAKTDPTSDDPKRVRGTGALYRNEVNVYTRLQPSTFLEAPAVLGGVYDPETATFLLLMEDLRDRGASFGAVTTPVGLDTVRSLLDQLASLHARFWNSPDFADGLSWMEAHTRGDLHLVFNTPQAAPAFIAQQVEQEQFKREMVQRLGTTVDGLFRGFQRVQAHQARLPQTVCHGDTHIGNTYALPDGRGGLLDWQLASQGYAMHDVSYLVATALPVAERRTHERELLAYYREQLLAKGVADAPSLDDLWLEYRRAMVWGVYIGWLTTPVVNYGWEITVMNHLRIMTAYEDLETGRLIDALG